MTDSQPSLTAVPGDHGDPGLVARIRGEITRSGPISFFRFMELALYDPVGGYYSRGSAGLGRAGDFVTAADAGRHFGHCLARQLIEIDAVLDGPSPFTVLEYGAGRGLLARDVLDALAEFAPGLSARIDYRMIDRSAGMRAEASRRVPTARVVAPGEEGRNHRGCVLAVELFDALPVYLLRRRRGKLREVRVGVGPAGFVEREVEAAADLVAWADRYGAATEEGQQAEIAPTLPREFGRMSQALERGVWIVVDYGDRAERLYGASRPHGTLLAYRRQRTHADCLARVGRQDLTAHVNFSALTDAARESGLDVLGLTTQDRFLIGNGIIDTFAPPDESRTHDPRLAKHRLQALQLIHPSGMGRAFQVLLLSRGL